MFESTGKSFQQIMLANNLQSSFFKFRSCLQTVANECSVFLVARWKRKARNRVSKSECVSNMASVS
jgi:hypothetical protein